MRQRHGVCDLRSLRRQQSASLLRRAEIPDVDQPVDHARVYWGPVDKICQEKRPDRNRRSGCSDDDYRALRRRRREAWQRAFACPRFHGRKPREAIGQEPAVWIARTGSTWSDALLRWSEIADVAWSGRELENWKITAMSRAGEQGRIRQCAGSQYDTRSDPSCAKADGSGRSGCFAWLGCFSREPDMGSA